jgi:hypothetical protein
LQSASVDSCQLPLLCGRYGGRATAKQANGTILASLKQYKRAGDVLSSYQPLKFDCAQQTVPGFVFSPCVSALLQQYTSFVVLLD